jgi:hypothetical protein
LKVTESEESLVVGCVSKEKEKEKEKENIKIINRNEEREVGDEETDKEGKELGSEEWKRDEWGKRTVMWVARESGEKSVRGERTVMSGEEFRTSRKRTPEREGRTETESGVMGEKRKKVASVDQRDEDVREQTRIARKEVHTIIEIEGVKTRVLRSCCIDDVNPLMIMGRLGTSMRKRGKKASMTVDTGAVAQCMDFDFACEKAGGEDKLIAKEEEEMGLYSASGKKLKERGSSCFCVEVGGVKTWCQFTLVENLALDVILGCGWQEEQNLMIDWEHKIIQPKDGMCVPFVRARMAGREVGCVIPEASEELKLYPAEEVCIPGRGVKCVGFRAKGAWEGAERMVGYVRGFAQKKKFLLAEGVGFLEEGMVWAAVTMDFKPHR